MVRLAVWSGVPTEKEEDEEKEKEEEKSEHCGGGFSNLMVAGLFRALN